MPIESKRWPGWLELDWIRDEILVGDRIETNPDNDPSSKSAYEIWQPHKSAHSWWGNKPERWMAYRMIGGYKRPPRKLKLNQIHSEPVPLP